MENKFLTLSDLHLGMFIKGNTDVVYTVLAFGDGKVILKNKEDDLNGVFNEELFNLNRFKKCDCFGQIMSEVKLEIKYEKTKNKNMESISQEGKLQKIKINSEMEAILISPKMHGTMALLDLATLKRIVENLSTASFIQIKETFVEKIKNTKELDSLVQVTKDEVNFHESINLIKTIEVNEDIKPSTH